jgi:hypothetical protein
MFKINRILTVVTIVMAMAATAFGVVSWDGGGDGVSWSDGLNWSSNTVPVELDGAVTIGGGVSVKLETASQPKIFSLYIEGGADLTISASIDVADRVRIGGTGAGTLYLTAGTLNVGNKIYNGASAIGGVGIFEISGTGSSDSQYIENGTGDSHGTLRIKGDTATIDMVDFRQNSGAGTIELVFMDGGNGGGISTITVSEDSKANKTLAVDLSAYTLPSTQTDYDVIVAADLRSDTFDSVTIDGVPIASVDDWSIAYVDTKIVRLSYAGSGIPAVPPGTVFIIQ